MHRYFLIPVLSFFSFICIFVIYLQFINEDWKFLVPKKELPIICNDETDVELITHKEDIIDGRSFNDKDDQFENMQLHAILMLPCEMEDRKFDINYSIESSLLAINKWFMEKSKIQKIQFDKKLNTLHLNPGAAGNHGFHNVRTMIRFTIDKDQIKDMEIIELATRG